MIERDDTALSLRALISAGEFDTVQRFIEVNAMSKEDEDNRADNDNGGLEDDVASGRSKNNNNGVEEDSSSENEEDNGIENNVCSIEIDKDGAVRTSRRRRPAFPGFTLIEFPKEKDRLSVRKSATQEIGEHFKVGAQGHS
ncbi:hypothetical protein P280DRAFT_483042 [Massarina eburnea CBS 473.64]|uniref:Uncharacterized protein n=1 Tax=Massarina eburnea CBS 473.64 TaxID=1395130 RepID=A0A6A6RPT3_9PLEO|nr:hypothetical protein P280DRAFT_483042 [Massarina eburnea CBS 473.64]